MDHLRTAHAQALRQAMLEARNAFQQARDVQESAFAALDADASADGALALRRAGQAYAKAVTEYSNALMAWLAFVERVLHEPKRP